MMSTQQYVPQWSVGEIILTAGKEYDNPYTDVEVYAVFTGPGNETLRRPAFWDGGNTWKVRFAPPTASGTWTWHTVCSNPADTGLHEKQGSLEAVAPSDSNPFLRAGLLRMSPNHRNVVRADGSPLFLVGDTAWSLPWRATPEAVKIYAADRRDKGFNCVLLMSILPDADAVGPRNRQQIGGFDVGFEDFSTGHMNQMNVAYFQYMDELMALLLEHGIVPIYSPVFQGYGWQGKNVLGNRLPPSEYARYCRFLVARYGAQPAMWLVSADSHGLAPTVDAGGQEFEAWDDYHQPAGIHYSPSDKDHQNRSYQDAEWLDFQWCQTGHDGTDTIKVTAMCDNLPIKGVANGEPTYEGIADPTRAIGWWQGNEAWSNLTAGGTMGVFYGVAALWQWKLTADEPGWPAWAIDHHSWSSALHLEGSTYVGYVGRALAGFDFIDMEKHPELAGGKSCVAKPGKFYCVYLPTGGKVTLTGLTEPLPSYWFNPRTGEMQDHGLAAVATYTTSAPDAQPWVLLVGVRKETN